MYLAASGKGSAACPAQAVPAAQASPPLPSRLGRSFHLLFRSFDWRSVKVREMPSFTTNHGYNGDLNTNMQWLSVPQDQYVQKAALENRRRCCERMFYQEVRRGSYGSRITHDPAERLAVPASGIRVISAGINGTSSKEVILYE
ncbi:hypothetical protein B0H21DRAFT_708283 [Amylocystis lapponica]|nr:hypothetical protein B0H21DRAFT_708283 [Amylocystis lapponica]